MSVKQALARVTEPRLQLIESDQPGLPQFRRLSGSAPIDVSMVLFNGDEDKSLAYLQHHSSQNPRPALFGLLKERSPGLMKRVIRAGADELLFLPLDPGDLTRALLKVSENRIRICTPRRRRSDFAGQYRRRGRGHVRSRPTSRWRCATS